MEQIIKKILEIEQKALEITDEAKDQKAHFEESLKQEAAQLKKEYDERVQKRIDTVRRVEKELLDEKVSEVQAGAAEQLAHLNSVYAEKKDGFIEDIVTFVLA